MLAHLSLPAHERERWLLFLKRRAAALEAAALTPTVVVPLAEIQAAKEEAEAKCEFCPDGPGRCCVCSAFDVALEGRP